MRDTRSGLVGNELRNSIIRFHASPSDVEKKSNIPCYICSEMFRRPGHVPVFLSTERCEDGRDSEFDQRYSRDLPVTCLDVDHNIGASVPEACLYLNRVGHLRRFCCGQGEVFAVLRALDEICGLLPGSFSAASCILCPTGTYSTGAGLLRLKPEGSGMFDSSPRQGS
jgi:hypothetical protein